MQTTEQQVLQARVDEMERAAQIATAHHDFDFAKQLSQYAKKLQHQIARVVAQPA